MGKKVKLPGCYELYIDEENHENIKVNEDGTRSAIQFTDEKNKLDGPLDYRKIDMDEVQEYSREGNIGLLVKLAIDCIIVPIVNEGLKWGTDKILQYLHDKGIPAAKRNARQLKDNAGLYIEGIKDVLSGKEPKINRILREEQMPENIADIDVSKERSTEEKSAEEVQQLLETLKTSILVTAICIRTLTDVVVKDDGSNPGKIEENRKQLEAFATQEVMGQISLMLEERSRDLLDEGTRQLLKAFRNGNFIVDGKEVPIEHYLPISETTLNSEKM